MDLFYTPEIASTLTLNEDESQHCIRVLRHQNADEIEVFDGLGTLYTARITSPHPRHTEVEILNAIHDYNSHPYHLTMAVAPTKNIDRYEWFVEKAVEIGVDRITPLLCQFSERKTIKRDRLEKIVIAAAKQSRKALLPIIDDLTPIHDFLNTFNDLQHSTPNHIYIAHCHDGAKPHLKNALTPNQRSLTVETGLAPSSHDTIDTILAPSSHDTIETTPASSPHHITIMIGPEGDFSFDEVAAALSKGATPISLGTSRLRTETAALVATNIVSLHWS